MIAAAPMTTTNAPITVSAFSYSSQRGVIRLSITLDCWKKSCQGATVVPTTATISSAEFDVRPPSTPGTKNPLSDAPGSGWLSNTSGRTSKLAKRNTNMARSQRRKLPLTVMPIRRSAAMGTAMKMLRPKYCPARLMPMNSVLMVRKLSKKMPPAENQPQKRPKRSLMSRA